MKSARWGCLVLCMLGVAVHPAWGGTNYVDIANPTPGTPFTTPATAATNIQDAIDAAQSGNTILVSPGVYDSGGRFYESLTNRVILSNSVLVIAASADPADTLIVGAGDPGTGTNGPGATRCAYLRDAGCRLVGFTLTNGWTASTDATTRGAGGGVKGIGMVSNCVITGCSAFYGGGAYGNTLRDCRLAVNQASRGGGMYESTLIQCVVTGCVAGFGGATCNGVVSNSTILNCSTLLAVGAASYYTAFYNSQIADCVGGYAFWGGSLVGCVVSNCEAGISGGVVSNSVISGCLTNSTANGSAIYNSTISNCMSYGGVLASLHNCTVTNSTITDCLGGLVVRGSTLRSCVLRNNRSNITLQECTVWDSVIENNTNTVTMAGVYTRCRLVGNNGTYVFRPNVFSNCVVTGNSGTSWGVLINCLVANNRTNATSEVHLFRPSRLVNCTVVSNTATTLFGSYSGLSSLTNCIVYYNNGKPFYTGTYVDYSCVSSNTGVVGTGNTTNAPWFTDMDNGDYTLAGRRSPCVDTGITLDWMTNSVDLAGEPRVWRGVVDMGAYEAHIIERGTVIVLM